MKKITVLVFAFLLALSLSACNEGYLGEDNPSQTTTLATPTTTVAQTNAAANTDVDDLVAILNNNSYTLTVHDASAIQYFTENTLENNYQIYVTVTDLIMGDASGSDWVQIVGFASEADAIAYTDAVDTLDGGELYYRNGTAVLFTYSQAAVDLFV